VVLLAAAIEQEETVQALTYGVRGMLRKDAARPLLFECVRTVAGGRVWVGHERIADVMQTLRRIERPPAGEGRPASRLTGRELQVVVDGETNKDNGGRCDWNWRCTRCTTGCSRVSPSMPRPAGSRRRGWAPEPPGHPGSILVSDTYRDDRGGSDRHRRFAGTVFGFLFTVGSVAFPRGRSATSRRPSASASA
jgi:hypothetical protein